MTVLSHHILEVWEFLKRDPNPNASLIGILSSETNPSEKVQGLWKASSGQPFQGASPGFFSAFCSIFHFWTHRVISILLYFFNCGYAKESRVGGGELRSYLPVWVSFKIRTGSACPGHSPRGQLDTKFREGPWARWTQVQLTFTECCLQAWHLAEGSTVISLCNLHNNSVS